MEQAHHNLDDGLDDYSGESLNDQAAEHLRGQAQDRAASQAEEPGEPLARVRYGVAKELRLYPDSLVVEYLEAHEETRITLDNIKRLILTPGEYNPSKLVLMVDLDDGNTVIVAEGMTNVRAFRVLLAKLQEIRPQIELDPPDMDTQLQQALDIRRRSLLGCYGGMMGLCVALSIIYLVVAYIGMHAGH
jgi:hypothetical protein